MRRERHIPIQHLPEALDPYRAPTPQAQAERRDNRPTGLLSTYEAMKREERQRSILAARDRGISR